MCSTAAVGIDLGTTFCCLAVFQKGRPEVIKVQSQRTVPSTVFYHHKKLDVSVGYDAEDEAPMCYANEIYDAKRLIGRKYNDEYVLRLVKANSYPFAISSQNGDATFDVKYKSVVLHKKPEDVSSELLRVLRDAASEYLGQEVTEAVVSVPAYFSNAQRKATKRAAELAGLSVLRFMSEPVAAAVQYTYGEAIYKTLLVFDFGGGTLDVSIIEVEGKTYAVKAVHGDTTLGGRDIDAILVEHFKRSMDADDTILMRRLNINCVKLKKKLSVQRAVDKEVGQAFFYNEKDYSLSMSRKTFDELNSEIYERAIDVVAVCLDKAGINENAIDEVLLVGGSCKILRVQELLQQFFPGKPLRKDVDPDEAIAMGACIQAAVLKKGNGDLENYTINEVTPLSLGVNSYGGLMAVIIPRNSQVPIKNSMPFISTENDPLNEVVQIYEGERSQALLNNKLGEFTINGIPKGKAGQVDYDVTFNLDQDGILEISVTVISTGKKESLIVTVSNFQLCGNGVTKSLKEAKENEREDRIFVEFVESRNKKIRLCNSVQYDAKGIRDAHDKTVLQNECSKFIAIAQKMNFHDVDVLNATYKLLCKKLAPFIRRQSRYILQVDREAIEKVAES